MTRIIRVHTLFSLTLIASVGCSQTTNAPASAPSAPTSAPATEAIPSASAKPAMAMVEHRSSPLPIGADVVMADVEMKNIDGQMFSFDGIKGDKGTLIVFTCNHCPYAQAWEARIATAGNAAMKMGFGVIAVNPNDTKAFPEDGLEEMKRRATAVGFEFPYVVDATSDVARAFGASKTPEVFLFDAGGKLVYYGAVDDNYRDAAKVEQTYLEDALKAVAGGQPVAKTVTKALGCSIKFRSRA